MKLKAVITVLFSWDTKKLKPCLRSTLSTLSLAIMSVTSSVSFHLTGTRIRYSNNTLILIFRASDAAHYSLLENLPR